MTPANGESFVSGTWTMSRFICHEPESFRCFPVSRSANGPARRLAQGSKLLTGLLLLLLLLCPGVSRLNAAQPPATAPGNAAGAAQQEAGAAQQEKGPQESATALGERQRLVERKMAELEERFAVIARELAEKEPEQAQKMVLAFQQARERLITSRMAEVAKLLDAGQTGEAGKQLDQVIASLDELVRLLVNRKDDKLDREQEEKMLEKWKQELEQLRSEQADQREESEKLADKDETQKKLAQQVEKVKQLIERQRKLAEQTNESADKGIAELDRVADQQFDIRKETSELAREIAGNRFPPGGQAADEENPEGKLDSPGAENPSADQPSGQSDAGDAGKTPPDANKGAGKQDSDRTGKKPGEESGKEGMPAGDPESSDKPGEGDNKPGESSDKPGETGGEKQSGKSGKPETGDNKQDPPSDSGKPETGDKGGSDPSGSDGQKKPGEKSAAGQSGPPPGSEAQSSPPSGNSSGKPQPGEQPLQKAADHQQRAEEKLATGKPEDALRQQQAAIAELDKARAELEKEQRRIASLPPEAFERMAAEQRRTRDKAMDLLKEMKAAPRSEKAEEQAGENGSAAPQPGQNEVEQAGESMENAAGDLDEDAPEDAARKQKQAEKKLQEALQQIEDRLAQLRDETREEKLDRLEARFREMLERQRSASLTTIEMDDRAVTLGDRSRRDRLLALKLSAEEAEIAELGRQAYDLLLEDGTSIVFPEMIHDLGLQLERAAELLREPRTDQLTQLVQREIESSLVELLDALDESKNKDGDGGGGGGGGGGGEQPLLKKSAELKMLRARQIRINRQTFQLDRMSKADGDMEVREELRNTARQQEQLLEMAEKIGEGAGGKP